MEHKIYHTNNILTADGSKNKFVIYYKSDGIKLYHFLSINSIFTERQFNVRHFNIAEYNNYEYRIYDNNDKYVQRRCSDEGYLYCMCCGDYCIKENFWEKDSIIPYYISMCKLCRSIFPQMIYAKNRVKIFLLNCIIEKYLISLIRYFSIMQFNKLLTKKSKDIFLFKSKNILKMKRLCSSDIKRNLEIALMDIGSNQFSEEILDISELAKVLITKCSLVYSNYIYHSYIQIVPHEIWTHIFNFLHDDIKFWAPLRTVSKLWLRCIYGLKHLCICKTNSLDDYTDNFIYQFQSLDSLKIHKNPTLKIGGIYISSKTFLKNFLEM
jgi:hypothetical protein